MRAIGTGSATCWLRLAAGVIGALTATLMLETRNRRLEDIAP